MSSYLYSLWFFVFSKTARFDLLAVQVVDWRNTVISHVDAGMNCLVLQGETRFQGIACDMPCNH